MKIEYREFRQWSEETLTQLAQQPEKAALHRFQAELAGLAGDLLEVCAAAEALADGNWWTTLHGWPALARQLRDPLGPARRRMAGMQRRWSKP